ncbi:MAG: hypothetical protein WDA42_06210, partial [Candidatus Bathyarchaeia archaeon]
WQPRSICINSTRLRKIVSTLFIIIIVGTITYSCYNAYEMTERDQINIPTKEATAYLSNHLNADESAVLVCSFNLLSQDMFRFYLPSNMSWTQIWQYPSLAVDAFTPDFNITEFVELCQERNVKYIILYDYGSHNQFFNTSLDYFQIQQMIFETGRFDDPQERPFWGEYYGWYGYRIFLVRFLG